MIDQLYSKFSKSLFLYLSNRRISHCLNLCHVWHNRQKINKTVPFHLIYAAILSWLSRIHIDKHVWKNTHFLQLQQDPARFRLTHLRQTNWYLSKDLCNVHWWMNTDNYSFMCSEVFSGKRVGNVSLPNPTCTVSIRKKKKKKADWTKKQAMEKSDN